MIFAFQFLDVAVVVVVLASAIYATYRGFVSESLDIFGWVAAAYATLFFGPWVAWWMRPMMNPPWLGEAAGYLLVFLIVLVPLHFTAGRISQNVKKSQVGTLDSVLGTAFGILRGIAIIGIAYLVFTAWVPYRTQPGWITSARLYPAIRASAEVVSSLIPDQNVRVPKERRESADPIVQKLMETSPEPPRPAAKPARKTVEPAPVKPKPHPKKTYGAKDRQALDRLIETTNSDTSGKR
jgi:membrane protein required for colicin V production